jgi:hypothetical protein
MKNAFGAALAMLCLSLPAHAQSACPPAGYDAARLQAIKAQDWAAPNARERNQLARALTACLASPDPGLRDGVAFEALAHWLRARQLSVETMRALAGDLDARLSAEDPAGVGRPFAALALSEVVRADRIEAYLDAATRARLLDRSIAYFTGVRDYRGFDEREGWRHGVAHGADLMLQFALNPALAAAELTRVRDALAGQVAPEGHFYIYGESERLARPIIYMARRALIPEEEWTRWFAQFAPAEGENLFASQAGLARRHNINAFLQTVWINARLSQDAADDALLPGAEAALRAMP